MTETIKVYAVGYISNCMFSSGGKLKYFSNEETAKDFAKNILETKEASEVFMINERKLELNKDSIVKFLNDYHGDA